MRINRIMLMLTVLLLNSFTIAQSNTTITTTTITPPTVVTTITNPYTPAFSGTSFNATLSNVTLPGIKGVITGAETGISMNLGSNLTIGPDTIIGQGYSFLGGRSNQVIPQFSKWLNNHSATLNGYQLQLYLTESLGVVNTTRNGANISHWAEGAGVGLNYALNGNVGVAIEYRWFNMPDVQHNGKTIVFGPNFHF